MRYYDGCPDDELKALLDDSALADKELAAVGMRATYFPVEQKWMVFNSDHHPVTEFYPTKRAAVNAALLK